MKIENQRHFAFEASAQDLGDQVVVWVLPMTSYKTLAIISLQENDTGCSLRPPPGESAYSPILRRRPKEGHCEI